MTKRLDKLRQQQEQLLQRIRQESAKERGRERKLVTRRKILLGSLLESMMEKDATLKADVDRRLESFLMRPLDREAFGLAVDDSAETPPAAGRDAAPPQSGSAA